MDEIRKKVLADVVNIISSMNLDENFAENVLKRLESFGYVIKEVDSWIIGFNIQKTVNSIKNYCNIELLPKELFNVAIDRACGEFLLSKKQTGQLDIMALDLSGAISSIKEGDTQVNFDVGTSDTAMIDQFIGYLIGRGDGELVCFRKIVW